MRSTLPVASMKQNILAVVVTLACFTHVSSRVIGARSTKSVLKQRVHAPRHFIPHSENAQKQRATNEASGKAFFFAAFKKQNPLEAAKLAPCPMLSPHHPQRLSPHTRKQCPQRAYLLPVQVQRRHCRLSRLVAKGSQGRRLETHQATACSEC